MRARILWRTADLDGTAMRLASVVGGRVDEHPGGDGTSGGRELIVPFVGGDVVIVPAGDDPDRLALGEASPDRDTASPLLRGAPRLLGVGWATVDAGRAIPELAATLGLEPGAFAAAAPDDTLGATTHVARLGPLTVAVLEPSTEGRLAAALARSGEGPCAIYVGIASSGTALSGPLGPGWLAMADRRWGPFVVAVARGAATDPGGRGTIAR